MSSNTKLTPEQKDFLKKMRPMLPEGATMKALGRMTVLCVPGGNVTHVYSSVASPDEKKIRRKVGEFYALQRWTCQPGFILPGFWCAHEVLEVLNNYYGFDTEL